MTTEVLRNMIYARSPALERLRFVVLDEVHYLQDAYRGPVWEEVIIHLPPNRCGSCACRPPCPTRTSWPTGSSTVRGPTAVVVEHRRPVELENLYLVDDRMQDELALLADAGRRASPTREGRRFDIEPRQSWRGRTRRRYATPESPRRRRVAGRAGNAPRDLLHLQPRRL